MLLTSYCLSFIPLTFCVARLDIKYFSPTLKNLEVYLLVGLLTKCPDGHSAALASVKRPIDLFHRGVKQQPCRAAGGTVNFYHTNNPQSQLP